MNFTPPPPPLRINRTLLSVHTHDTHPRASQVTLSRTVKIIHFIFFVSSFFPHILAQRTTSTSFDSPLPHISSPFCRLVLCLLAFFSVLFSSSLLMIRFSPCCVQSAFNLWWMNIVKLEESVFFRPPHKKTWKYFSFYIPNSRLFGSVGVLSAANNILSLRARQLWKHTKHSSILLFFAAGFTEHK